MPSMQMAMTEGRSKLIVVVVQVADGAPMFDLLRCLAEVAGEGLHAAADVRGVEQKVWVLRCCREQFLCA